MQKAEYVLWNKLNNNNEWKLYAQYNKYISKADKFPAENFNCSSFHKRFDTGNKYVLYANMLV